MRNKFFAVVALALVAAASVVLWRSLDSGPVASPPAADASPVADTAPAADAGVVDAGGTPRGPESPVPSRAAEPDLAAAFYAARSAKEALAIIEKGRLAGLPEANDAMLELDGVCAPGVAGPPGQPWVDEWLRNYCAGYVPLSREDGAAEHMRLQTVAASRATTRALMQALGEVGTAERGPLVLDALGAARNPYDVRATLQVAAAEDIPVLPIPNDQAMGKYGRRDTLNLASEIVFCRMTQGCGPGSMPAVSGCLVTGVCNQGMGMEDIYRQSVSPVMFRDADALATELLNGRVARE